MRGKKFVLNTMCMMLAFVFFAACGSQRNDDASFYALQTQAEIEYSQAVLPSLPQGTTSNPLFLGVNIKINKDSSFQYDPEKWQFQLRLISNNTTVDKIDLDKKNPLVELVEGKGKQTGFVNRYHEWKITFANNEIPSRWQNIFQKIAEEGNRIELEISYDSTLKPYVFRWENKPGFFKEAPKPLLDIGNRSIIVSLSPVGNLPLYTFDSLTKTLQKTQDEIEPTAYEIIYWNTDNPDCQQSFIFQENPKTTTGTPQNLSCSYTIQGESCTFTCHDPRQSSISAAERAIPTQSQSCYKIERLDKARSYTIIGKPGEQYAVMVYALNYNKYDVSSRVCAVKRLVEYPNIADGYAGGQSLSQSDCFIATAASDSAQSHVVQKWRFIRDTWLKGSAFVDWYYRHSPRYAAWLREHPEWKKPVRITLDITGSILVQLEILRQVASEKLEAFYDSLVKVFENFWSSKAYAEESIKYPKIEQKLSLAIQPVKLLKEIRQWEAYFPRPMPISLQLIHNYNLITSPWIDFALGYSALYYDMYGKYPAVDYPKNAPEGRILPSYVVGKKFFMYVIGFHGEADLHFKIPEFPYASFRGSLGYGRQRLRTENFAASTTEARFGYTLWKNMLLTRMVLEFPMSPWFYKDVATAKAFGVSELTFNVNIQYHNDLSQTFPISALLIGGGFSFFF